MAIVIMLTWSLKLVVEGVLLVLILVFLRFARLAIDSVLMIRSFQSKFEGLIFFFGGFFSVTKTINLLWVIKFEKKCIKAGLTACLFMWFNSKGGSFNCSCFP